MRPRGTTFISEGPFDEVEFDPEENTNCFLGAQFVLTKDLDGHQEYESVNKKAWYVYIIECCDGRLYTGISSDVNKRVAMHNKGKGCRFTKFRYPVNLRYTECCNSKSMARRRELEIQKLRRSEKLDLIVMSKY